MARRSGKRCERTVATLHKQHAAPAPTPLGAAAIRTTTHTGKRAAPLINTEHIAMPTSRTAGTAPLALAQVVAAAAVAVALAVALIIAIVLVIATTTPGIKRGRWRYRPHRKHRPTNTGRAAMATASRPRSGPSRLPRSGIRRKLLPGSERGGGEREVTPQVFALDLTNPAASAMLMQ